MDAGETTADLIAIALRDGIVVTARQIERWRYEKLLPRNARRGRGQRTGSTWTYESDIGPRFFAVADFVIVRGLPIAEAGVRLWMRGFEMDTNVLRRHLRAASASMRRLRTKLANVGAESVRDHFLDALRRQPKRRMEWGMSGWNAPERDRVANFAENLAQAYIATGNDLSPESIEVAKTALGISPDVNATLMAGGINIGDLFRTALPRYTELDVIAEAATDEELLRARTICMVISNRPPIPVMATTSGLPESLVARWMSTGLEGTRGLLTVIAAARWARDARATKDGI